MDDNQNQGGMGGGMPPAGDQPMTPPTAPTDQPTSQPSPAPEPAPQEPATPASEPEVGSGDQGGQNPTGGSTPGM